VSPYAETTTVSPEKSRADIEQVLTRYGAERFAYMTEPGRAAVMFDLKDRRVRFMISIPGGADFAYKQGRYGREKRTDIQRDKAWAQEVRRRWRALYLVIKAKLEAVESGIETLDEAFLSHMVLPTGQTFAEWVTPQLTAAMVDMPPLLPGSTTEAEIIDIDEARS
jgi:hypothetical protein